MHNAHLALLSLPDDPSLRDRCGLCHVSLHIGDTQTLQLHVLTCPDFLTDALQPPQRAFFFFQCILKLILMLLFLCFHFANSFNSAFHFHVSFDLCFRFFFVFHFFVCFFLKKNVSFSHPFPPYFCCHVLCFFGPLSWYLLCGLQKSSRGVCKRGQATISTTRSIRPQPTHPRFVEVRGLGLAAVVAPGFGLRRCLLILSFLHVSSFCMLFPLVFHVWVSLHLVYSSILHIFLERSLGGDKNEEYIVRISGQR